MNINDEVWVRLTPAGQAVYQKYWDTVAEILDAPVRVASEMGTDGWWRFQLWRLMEVFGPVTHLTGDLLFEENEIRLEAP